MLRLLLHNEIMTNQTSYVPGMCNINRAEVAYRRKAMWFGVGLSVLMLIVAVVVDLAWWLTAVLLFVPVYIAAIGFLQVRNRFCVSYGTSGQHNADEISISAQSVEEVAAKEADKKKARTMNTQAFVATMFIVLLSCFIPVL